MNEQLKKAVDVLVALAEDQDVEVHDRIKAAAVILDHAHVLPDSSS